MSTTTTKDMWHAKPPPNLTVTDPEFIDVWEMARAQGHKLEQVRAAGLSGPNTTTP